MTDIATVISNERERIQRFVIDTAAGVLSANVTEIERGVLALDLLRLLAAASQSSMPIVPVRAVIPVADSTVRGHTRKTRFTDEQLKAAVDEGLGNVAISERFGCSVTLVKFAKRRLGLSRSYTRSHSSAGTIVWDDANRARLVAAFARDPKPTIAQVADEFGTTAGAIQTAASRFGCTRRTNSLHDAKPLKPRKCICCQKPFMSEGPGNWQCPKCRVKNGIDESNTEAA